MLLTQYLSRIFLPASNTEAQATNAAESTSANQQQETMLPPIDEEDAVDIEQDEDEIQNDQEQDEGVKVSSADTTSVEGNGFTQYISGLKNKMFSGSSSSSTSRRPMPSRGDTRSRGRQSNRSSRSHSRSRSRSRSSSRDSNDSSSDATRWVRHDKVRSGEDVGEVLDDSEDDNEVNEMDTHEFITEGVVQDKGKKRKVEKERGTTSLQAAAARVAAANKENAFVDGLMDMENIESGSL